MFISLPSYPPRPHARSWVQDPASPQQLQVPHPAPMTSSLRAPQDMQQGSQLAADHLFIEPLSSWKSNTHSPTHSEEQLWQLLAVTAGDVADAGDFADEAVLAWLDADSQLAAACVAPALPIGECTAASHEAALVAISRALSLTVLGSDPAANASAAGEAGALESNEVVLEGRSSGETAVWAALSSNLGQQRSVELTELSVEEFEAMTAECLPLERAQAPQYSVSGSDAFAAEACDAFLTAHCSSMEFDAHFQHSMALAVPLVCSLSADVADGIGAWQPCAPEAGVHELQFEFPLGHSQHGQAETPNSSTAASGYVAGSDSEFLAQLPGKSDASDAMLDLPMLSQHGMPPEAAALPVAMPESYEGDQDATSALDGNNRVSPESTLSAGRRRRRAATEPPLDEQSKVERNRQQQREYVKRKRARAAVTNALADNLQSRVESLKADIERLHSRQIQLLGANSQQMVAPAGHVITPSAYSYSISGTLTNAEKSADAKMAALAVRMDVTRGQRTAVIQLYMQTTAELSTLEAERKQLAQRLKAAPAGFTSHTLCEDMLSTADMARRIQANLQVQSGLQQSFADACREVLTGEQLRVMESLACTHLVDMQALCRGLMQKEGRSSD